MVKAGVSGFEFLLQSDGVGGDEAIERDGFATCLEELAEGVLELLEEMGVKGGVGLLVKEGQGDGLGACLDLDEQGALEKALKDLGVGLGGGDLGEELVG